MKKIITMILIMFLIGCQNISDEQKAFDKYFNTLKQTETFESNDNLPFDLEIKRSNDSIKDYHYEFVITNPQQVFDNLKIAILPLNYKNDEIIPTFNIIEEVDISSFNNNETGIKLNYFSQHKYSTFKILVEYNNNQKIFLIEK